MDAGVQPEQRRFERGQVFLGLGEERLTVSFEIAPFGVIPTSRYEAVHNLKEPGRVERLDDPSGGTRRASFALTLVVDSVVSTRIGVNRYSD